MKQTFQSFPYTPLVGVGASPKMRLAADSKFQATTGEVHPAGDSQHNYSEISLTPSGEGFVFPDTIIDTNDDSSDPNSTYTLYVVDTDGREVGTVFERWSFTASWGASVDYGDLEAFNVNRAPLRDDQSYSKVQSNYLLIGQYAPDASDTVKGKWYKSFIEAVTTATLPAAGIAGRVRRLTDGLRGFVFDTGTRWINALMGNICIEEYATLAAMIADIGATERTVYIPSSYSVAASATIPSNITLKFTGSGKLNVASGQTVTIQGAIEAPERPIFTGAGSVVNSGTTTTFVGWYATAGLGSSASPWTGWDTKIQWASDGNYRFGGAWYQTSTTLSLSGLSRIKLRGEGATVTFTGTGKIIRVYDPGSSRPSDVHIRDFHLVGNANATDGLSVEKVSNSCFENIWVSKVNRAALYTYWAISCDFDVKLSINSDGTSATPHPQYGYYLDGTSVEPTEACIFRNVLIEGATVRAILAVNIISCDFYVKVLEANAKGAELTTNCNAVNFFGGNYEANAYDFGTLTIHEGEDFLLTSCSNVHLVGIFSVGTVNVTAGVTQVYISGSLTNLTNNAPIGQLLMGAYTVSGTFTNSANASIIGSQSPVAHNIGGTRLTGSATGVLMQPTANGANVFEVSPKGAAAGVINLFNMDRVASPSDISGLVLYANNGGTLRLQSFAFGAGTRQNIEISADQSTYNSASSQLKVLTTGQVQIAQLTQSEGAVLSVSSNAIAPTNSIHHVGAGLIKNITVPTGFVSGTITIIPDAAFTTDTTGNIGLATTATIGRAMKFTYSSSSSKWYPSY